MNSNRMQGIYIEVKGSHPILQEVDMPIPLDGQVLIKVLSAPINPSDILFMNGVIDKKDYPCIPGFEGIGLVEKSGGGVVGWRLEGKHVAFMTDHKYGSYGQYAIAEAKYCMVVESFDHSISFINPLSVVCMYELCDKYKCVVSVGAGGQLGRMMSRYFQQRGLNVINIVRNELQASILRDEGAKIILMTEQEDFYEKYDKLAHTYQAQVLFDGIGGDISSKLIELLPHNSTVFCYSGTSLDVDPQQLMFQNKTIRGFNIYYELANRNYLELSLLYSLVQKNQRTLRTLPIKLVKEFTMEKKAERCIYIPSQ